jgi:hypothetical protein
MNRSSSTLRVLPSVLALSLFGCGGGDSPKSTATASSMGTPVFDASVTVDGYAISPDGTRAFALTTTTAQHELRAIDLATMTTSVLNVWPDDAARTELRRDDVGNFYFAKQAADGGRSLVRIDPSKNDYVETVLATWQPDALCEASFVVSSDGRSFGLCDDLGGSLLRNGARSPTAQPIVAFSPDGREALSSDFTIVNLDDGTTRSVAPAHDVYPHAHFRWTAGALESLTNDSQTVYVDDLLGGTSKKLWASQVREHAWADADHVFEGTSHCDGDGLAFDSCAHPVLDLALRGIADANDVTNVGHGPVAKIGEVQMLPDGQRFLWLGGGVLSVQASH